MKKYIKLKTCSTHELVIMLRFTFFFLMNYFFFLLEPMRNFNVSGVTWLRNGALLNLKVKCSGTGPFFYCYNITYGLFNESGKFSPLRLFGAGKKHH